MKGAPPIVSAYLNNARILSQIVMIGFVSLKYLPYFVMNLFTSGNLSDGILCAQIRINKP
jgi:hypothetical protein